MERNVHLSESLIPSPIDHRGVYLFMEWRDTDSSQRSSLRPCSGCPELASRATIQVPEYCNRRIGRRLLRDLHSNRIEGEHCLEFLIGRVGVRPVIRCTDFWKHADHDSKEA